MSPQEEVTEDLKEAIREARGFIKDTRELVKNLTELNVYTRQLIERNVEEEITLQVKEHLDEVLPKVQGALDRACEHVSEEFDRFTDVIYGRDKRSVREGRVPLTTLIHNYATKLNITDDPMSLLNTTRKKDGKP